MQKSVAEKRKDIEHQRRLAREKLQMKQLIKAKRMESNSKALTTTETPSSTTLLTSAVQGAIVAHQAETQPTEQEQKHEEEEKKKTLKPRSAAIERILAMSKRKRKNDSDSEKALSEPEKADSTSSNCSEQNVVESDKLVDRLEHSDQDACVSSEKQTETILPSPTPPPPPSQTPPPESFEPTECATSTTE